VELGQTRAEKLLSDKMFLSAKVKEAILVSAVKYLCPDVYQKKERKT
jgi:hypothetical protein